MTDEELAALIGKERFYREQVKNDWKALKVALPIVAVATIAVLIWIGV